MYMTEYVSL